MRILILFLLLSLNIEAQIPIGVMSASSNYRGIQSPSVPFGTIITDDWDNLNNWTDNGTAATFTPSSNELLLANGTGLYTHRIVYDPLVNSLENWVASFDFKITTDNAGGIGIDVQHEFSAQSTDRSFLARFQAVAGGSHGQTVIIKSNEGTTVRSVGATTGTLTYAVNDVIRIEFEREVYTYTVTVTNLTNPNSVNASYTAYNANVRAPNPACKFSIYTFGGTQTITSAFTVTSNSYKNIESLFIGDSKTVGLSATTFTDRFANVAYNGFTEKFEVNAGASDRSSQYTIQETHLESYNARFAFLILGGNDIRGGIAVNDVIDNLTIIRNFLTASGTTVIWCKYPEENTLKFVDFNNAIEAAADNHGDLWLGTENTDTGGRLAADNIHLSDVGHAYVAGIIRSALNDLVVMNYVPIPDPPVFSDPHTLIVGTTGVGIQIGDTNGKQDFYVGSNYNSMQFNIVNSDDYRMMSLNYTDPADWAVIGSPSPNDYSIDCINASHGIELYNLKFEGSDNLIKWPGTDTLETLKEIKIQNCNFSNAGFGSVIVNQNVAGDGYGKATFSFLRFTGTGAERFYLGKTALSVQKYMDTTRISHCYMDSSGREAVQMNNHKYVMVENITARHSGIVLEDPDQGIGQKNGFQAQGVGAGYIKNSIFEAVAPGMIASTGIDLINNRIIWSQTDRPIYFQDVANNNYHYKNVGDDTVVIDGNDFECSGYSLNYVLRFQEQDCVVVITNNRFPPSATDIYECDGPCPTIISSGNTFDSDDLPALTFGPSPDALYIGEEEVVTSDYDYFKHRGSRTP